MMRWRNNLLNGRWLLEQDGEDWWRVRDTTTSELLTGLYLSRKDARQAAEVEYYLACGILVRDA